MAAVGDYDGNNLCNKLSASGNTACGTARAREIVTRIELDSAYSFEKLLNLEMLLMHVASRAHDHETLVMDDNVISTDSIEKTFEFDILSGILSSEVKEMECFMRYVQNEIADARLKICLSSSLDMSLEEIEEKLHDAEESLRQSEDQVSEIKLQLEKFERIWSFEGKETCNRGEEFSEIDQVSSSHDQQKKQSVEQQRHTLQMLEKSLARELDLEKQLSDANHNEEEIRRKLHYAEYEMYCMEESIETIQERLFQAEHVAEVLTGVSKELIGKLQIIQFTLKSSTHRETEMRNKLENNMLMLSVEENDIADLSSTDNNALLQQVNDLKAKLEETEDKVTAANSEVVTLRRKVDSLGQCSTKSTVQLQQERASTGVLQQQHNLLNSEISEGENVITNLKENILKAESRAKNAEAKYRLLTETNLELNKELDFLKGDGAKKTNLLEKKLAESDVQLENAKASVEAIKEQQRMLYSALADMEHLIKNLKMEVSKAEKRAETADSKCNILTGTNLELNEELGSLRGRLECLEKSLWQANDTKAAIARDIGMRMKIITELVMKLSSERVRLQMQITLLRKQNKLLVEKCQNTDYNAHIFTTYVDHGSGEKVVFQKSSEESVTESSPANFSVDSSVALIPQKHDTCEQSKDTVDDTPVETTTLPVRTIEATQISLKHITMGILFVFISVFVMYLLQLERYLFV